MIISIDTSNYTTSVSAVSEGSIRYDLRRILTVKDGGRGLRQSEAFYQHIENLPELFAEIGGLEPDAVAVSVSPRRVEGSYMPCFKAGISVARIISQLQNIPLIRTTHQEGHIEAALFHNNDIDTQHFLCVQLSGGTTELLMCKKERDGFSSNIIGRTIDISAGQLIDRVGVLCGLSFPCGAEMDAAYDESAVIKMKTSLNGSDISFSGLEAQLLRAEKTASMIELISSAFYYVSTSVCESVQYAAKKYKLKQVLFAGGVSSGTNIRTKLNELEQVGISPYFASDHLGNDNAVGVALIGERVQKG